MEYIKESQILLPEELYSRPINYEDKITTATLRFRDNIRLTTYVVSKFPEPSDAALDTDDLLQAAHEGLWKACLSFDDTSGYKFSTYAVPFIRGYVMNTIRDSGPIMTPRYFNELKSTLLRRDMSIPLTADNINELVKEGKFTEEQILSYDELIVFSLDARIDDSDHSGTYGDIIADYCTQELSLSSEDLEYIIEYLLKYIPPKYKAVISEWLHAKVEGRKITQKTLATQFNCGQPNVNKILKRLDDVAIAHGDEIRSLFGL